jgi:hypothetical protein
MKLYVTNHKTAVSALLVIAIVVVVIVDVVESKPPSSIPYCTATMHQTFNVTGNNDISSNPVVACYTVADIVTVINGTNISTTTTATTRHGVWGGANWPWKICC